MLHTRNTQKELIIPPVGLGLAALGRPGYINLGHARDLADTDYEAMRQHTHRMLDLAYELGIRHFDTAASYGAGERFLGEWVFAKGLHVKGVRLSSKWGYRYTADWKVDAKVHEVKEHSLKNLDRSFALSCLRLGRALNIYQIHSATFESGVLDNSQVLDRLAEIRFHGRIIGLSVSGPQQSAIIDKAMMIAIDDAPLFGAVQATWNLLETSASDALKRAKDAGIIVIVKEALANGRLTQRNKDKGFRDKLSMLKAIARELGCTLDQLAIAAAVNQPWSDVVLSGASTKAQLKSNWGALNVAWEHTLARRLSGLIEPPACYWQTRSSLKWN